MFKVRVVIAVDCDLNTIPAHFMVFITLAVESWFKLLAYAVLPLCVGFNNHMSIYLNHE